MRRGNFMSNMNELDAFMMFLRTMNGEKNVIEHMEAEGQQKAVNNIMLAKNMRPSRESWERLGFTFLDIPDDDVLCKASLPEGWRIEATEHSMWNNIIDEKGRTRGSMFYKAAFYDRNAHMDLSCRYGVRSDYIDDDCTTTEIYFGNKDEKIFVAGQVHMPKDATKEVRFANYEKEEKLYELAKQFGNENYPNWLDASAYWDDEKDFTYQKSIIK